MSATMKALSIRTVSFYPTNADTDQTDHDLHCLPFQWHLLAVQLSFGGLNTDGSFTMAVLNSSFSPLEKIQQLQI